MIKSDSENILKGDAHPTPLDEIRFWQQKADNLQSIFSQLNSGAVKKIYRILELAKSSYFPAFPKLQEEVVEGVMLVFLRFLIMLALRSAQQNAQLLSPLGKYIRLMMDSTQDQYPKRTEIFTQMFYHVMLVWQHSQYFSSPSHLAIVFTEICNAFVDRTSRFVNSRVLFQMEIFDALQRIEEAIAICEKFQHAYEVSSSIKISHMSSLSVYPGKSTGRS